MAVIKAPGSYGIVADAGTPVTDAVVDTIVDIGFPHLFVAESPII